MTRNFIVLLTLLCYNLIVHAQGQDKDTLSNTIDQQFIQVINQSNSYENYKIIRKSKMNLLRSNVVDSINRLQNTIDLANEKIMAQQRHIDSLETGLGKTELELSESIENENAINFLGSKITKSTYNLLLWSIIIILILGLGLFIFKFRNSNLITKEAKNKLLEVEEEFERHRQRTLEEHQLLRRKLQDEILKNKKSK